MYATVRDHSHDADLRDGFDGRLSVLHLELRDRTEIGAVVSEIVRRQGHLDVLVNNAGYGIIGGIEQVDLDRVRDNFEANFFGTMALIQDVLPVMRRQRSGHIINVSTIFAAGLCPPAIGYYIASKAALETATQALAVEAAPWRVRVTNFQPGPVMTELSRVWGDRLSAEHDPRPGLSDELYTWIADGQGPEPQSPAQVADALCRLVESQSPALADQSGPAARAYVAAALHDPTRGHELEALQSGFAQTHAVAPNPA